MDVSQIPPLRYLSARDVAAAVPPIEERLALAEETMTALVDRSEMPPKVALHPRQSGSFAHAMPALLRRSRTGDAPEAADAAGAVDAALGVKWVAGFPANVALGLPNIHATSIVSDPATGLPLGFLDAGPITAQRTAAVSGIAIRRFAPPVEGRAPRVALVGAGIQGHSHVPVVAHLLPGCELRVSDANEPRAAALAEEAEATAGIGRAVAVATARDAIRDADVVITAAAFGPVRQVMTNDWLAADVLVVPIDYATYAAAEVAREAALFLVDERVQFLANREAGLFEEYPEPTMTIGEAILAGTPRPKGRVIVTHLGVGLADLVFARAILATAARMGLGIELPR